MTTGKPLVARSRRFQISGAAWSLVLRMPPRFGIFRVGVVVGAGRGVAVAAGAVLGVGSSSSPPHAATTRAKTIMRAVAVQNEVFMMRDKGAMLFLL